MFLGHIGLALAAKRVARRPSLGTLCLAAQLPDGLWPLFLLLGWEEVRIVPGITPVTPLMFMSYPYSHSLLACIVLGVLVGGIYYAKKQYLRGALWLAALVVSHWVLDWISHRADMPLWPGSPRHGLGLWNSLALTLIVEFALFAAGVWIYVQYTRPRDRWGKWLLASFVGVLVLVYLASVFGPPPPSVKVLAWSGLLGWLFLAWAYWIDRHRKRVDLDRKRSERHRARNKRRAERLLQGPSQGPPRDASRSSAQGMQHGTPRPDPAHR
ncbi:MAG: metal-dependent hydrolase [Betaproteobacteria bacterium]